MKTLLAKKNLKKVKEIIRNKANVGRVMIKYKKKGEHSAKRN